jgi:hypothetical protein
MAEFGTLEIHKGPVDSCPACARLESIWRPLEEWLGRLHRVQDHPYDGVEPGQAAVPDRVMAERQHLPKMTWRQLTALVEAAGFLDEELAHVHVMTDGPTPEDRADDLSGIEVFRNYGGTVTVMNSSCGRGYPSWDRPPGWQPMATAPRDGSTIILDLDPEEDGDSGIATGEWFQDQIRKGWWVRDYLVGENEPRAWHPVPARLKRDE